MKTRSGGCASVRLARYTSAREFWFATAKCHASSVFKNVARACQSRHRKPINTSDVATRSECFRKDKFRSLSQPWFARIVCAEFSVGGGLAIGCDCSNCDVPENSPVNCTSEVFNLKYSQFPRGRFHPPG